MSESWQITQIGTVRSPYRDPGTTPVQSTFSKGQGTLELLPEFTPGLSGIDTFTHLILLTRMHQAPAEQLSETPMVDGGESHGIFATRHMSRPNRIGLSIVRLLARKENILIIEGLDLLDGTPVLDIKPYIPAFDSIPEASSGWLTAQHIQNIKTRSQTLSA